MRKVIPFLIAILCCVTTLAQPLTGTKNIPGDYPDLQSAIGDLNLRGTAFPGVTLNVLPGNPQTAPPGGYTIQDFFGNGILATINGNGNTITAANNQSIGSTNDAIIKLIGSDDVTIDGFILQENAANLVTVVGTNNMTEFGVAIFHSSPTNGAKNITIQNCTITLNRTYPNTFGVFSTNRSDATSLNVANDITSPDGANDNVHIYNTDISNSNTGIACIGSLNGLYMPKGLDIGGSTIATGNSITNYGTTSLTYSYVSVSTTVNGIYLNNQLDVNIRQNEIASSIGGVTTNTALRGIYIQATGTLPISGLYNNVVSNNNISLRSAASSAIVQGITNELGSALVNLTISENNFHNSDHTAPSSGNIMFINNTGACQNTYITGNTYTSLSESTNGSITFISNTANRPANAVVTVANNSIVGTFNKTGSGGNVAFYVSNGNSDHTVIDNASGNNFSNITLVGTTTVNGWQNVDGSPSGKPYGSSKQVSNNIFQNITGGIGQMTILNIAFSNSEASNVVSNNLINNISCNCSIIGISSAGGSQSFFHNIVSNLNSTAASLVAGIQIIGGVWQNINANKIYGLIGTNAGSTVFGISSPSTSNIFENAVISNNLVGGLLAPNASGSDAIRGISIASAVEKAAYSVFHNTINLNANSTATNFGSSGVFINGNPSPSISRVDLRNNIIINTSIQKGTGRTVALRIANFLESYLLSSNNNLFFTGLPVTANNPLFTNNFMPLVTLTDLKNGMWPRDDNSISGQEIFLSTTGSDPNFLRPNPGVPSQAENSGDIIVWQNVDFDEMPRDPENPDIGAFEFTGIISDLSGPSIDFVPLPTTCQTGDRELINVFISDQSDVNKGANAPRIYYRKGNGAWFSRPGSFVRGTGKETVWNFNIQAADMGGLTPSDKVDYFIIAQDNSISSNLASTSPGIVASDVNTITTFPTMPRSYKVGNILGGTIPIGIGQTFPTLTSFSTAYNNGCLVGPVIGELRDPTYGPSEIFPIILEKNPYSSSFNSLTIRPANGVHVTINGSATAPAVIKLVGSNISIDGTSSSTESLKLINNNTAASTNIWITENYDLFAYETSFRGGLSVSYVDFEGVPTAYAINASGFGPAPSSIPIKRIAEIVIEHCTFLRMNTCIYGKAGTENGIYYWRIRNNVFGPATSGLNNITHAGVSLHGSQKLELTGNTFQNFSASANSPGGAILTYAKDFIIDKNVFNSLISAGTSTGTASISALNIGLFCKDGIIKNNLVSGIRNTNPAGAGAWGMTIISNHKLAGIDIFNNMITDVTTVQGNSIFTGPVGIAIDGSTSDVKITGNTIHLFGSHPGAASNPSGGSSAAFLFNTFGNNITLYNNILTNKYDNTTSTGDRSFAILCFSALFNGLIDYNVYDVSGLAGVLGGFSSFIYTDLAQLQAGIGGNMHSLVTPASYTSDLDLHLLQAGNPLLFNAGGPEVPLPDDADGDSRHAPNPTPGADELFDFNPPCSLQVEGPYDLDACANATELVLSVTVTGDPPPFFYQWYKGQIGNQFFPVAGATSQTLSLPPSETGLYWCKVSNPCMTVWSRSALITKQTKAVWTGKVNYDWNNPGNWQGGCVPSANVDVLIPSGSAIHLDPEIGTIYSARNLDVEAGASLFIFSNNATLIITGNAFNNGFIGNLDDVGDEELGNVIFASGTPQELFGLGTYRTAVTFDNPNGIVINQYSQLKFYLLLAKTGTPVQVNGAVKLID